MIIVDANVIVKLALEEMHSHEARKFIYKILLNGKEEITTVDIALAESLNALWKHNAVIKDLTNKKFELATNEILEFWGNLDKIPSDSIANEAIKVAQRCNLTIYDSLYAAASLQYKSPLFTFDRAVKEKAKRLGISLIE